MSVPAARNHAPEMDAAEYASHIYKQVETAVVQINTVITKYCELLEKTVSLHLEQNTTPAVRDVVMKFFKAIPETLMVLGLIMQNKLAMISGICWAVRTVISLMPLFKALLTMDNALITKGAQEAWKNLVEQHKNFIPACAIVALLATMGALNLLSLKAMAETAILATMTTGLFSLLIDKPAVADAMAGQDADLPSDTAPLSPAADLPPSTAQVEGRTCATSGASAGTASSDE